MRRACNKVMTDLDSVCWRPDFPAVAETLLQNFDALTRLSELDPRQRPLSRPMRLPLGPRATCGAPPPPSSPPACAPPIPARLVRANLHARPALGTRGRHRYPLTRPPRAWSRRARRRPPWPRAAERVLGRSHRRSPRGRHRPAAPSAADASPAGRPPGARRARPGRRGRGRGAGAQPRDRDDLLLVLLSGGASALLPAPVAGVTLADKAALTRQLLRAGATIRRAQHGAEAPVAPEGRRPGARGRRRRAWPAWSLSDVVGDDLVHHRLRADRAGPHDLRRRPRRAAAPRPARAGAGRRCARHLEAGARGERPETPKPGDPALPPACTTRIIGSNRLSVEAAAREARRQGLRPVVLTTRLEGEAREVARVLVAVLRECVEAGRPARAAGVPARGRRDDGDRARRGRGRPQPGAGGGRGRGRWPGFPCPPWWPRWPPTASTGSERAAGGVADDRSLARARAPGPGARRPPSSKRATPGRFWARWAT